MLYNFLKFIASIFLNILFRIKVIGIENVSKNDTYLICSNHISFIDFAFIGIKLKQKLFFLGKSEIVKNNIFAKLLFNLGLIPINRGSADVGAIRKVISEIKNGHSVLIFPQGTRKSGETVRNTRAKNGAALIQRETKCRILPVSIATNNMKVSIFKKIVITFGKPILPGALLEKSDNEITEIIFNKIINQSEANI